MYAWMDGCMHGCFCFINLCQGDPTYVFFNKEVKIVNTIIV